jgi:hypothetical protein
MINPKVPIIGNNSQNLLYRTVMFDLLEHYCDSDELCTFVGLHCGNFSIAFIYILINHEVLCVMFSSSSETGIRGTLLLPSTSSGFPREYGE